jgi:hypothetical protein
VTLAHINLKNRSRIKPWKVKNGKGTKKAGAPQNNTYIELCAMENLGGKIQFMICFYFWFLDFYAVVGRNLWPVC